MTKEDMTMCDAVRRGIDKRIGRGTVVHVSPDGYFRQVTLHGNTIAIFAKYAKFSTCGWNTATTCRKLNALLTLCDWGCGFSVRIRRGGAALFYHDKPVQDLADGKVFTDRDLKKIWEVQNG